MIIRRGALLVALALAACAETTPPAPSTATPAAASRPAPTPSNLPTTGQAGTERAMSTLQQDLDRAEEKLRSYDPHAQHQDLSAPRTPYEIGANTRLPTRR